jgi:hypothetical protein
MLDQVLRRTLSDVLLTEASVSRPLLCPSLRAGAFVRDPIQQDIEREPPHAGCGIEGLRKALEKPRTVRSAQAQEALKVEPPPGTLAPGSRWLIKDGSCSAGQIKEMIAGDIHTHVPRQRRCIPR